MSSTPFPTTSISSRRSDTQGTYRFFFLLFLTRLMLYNTTGALDISLVINHFCNKKFSRMHELIFGLFSFVSRGFFLCQVFWNYMFSMIYT